MIGELQHITYKEWLPIILGEEYMDTNDMMPAAQGFTNKYSQEVNPGITNVFATAAFRSVMFLNVCITYVEFSGSGIA